MKPQITLDQFQSSCKELFLIAKEEIYRNINLENPLYKPTKEDFKTYLMFYNLCSNDIMALTNYYISIHPLLEIDLERIAQNIILDLHIIGRGIRQHF